MAQREEIINNIGYKMTRAALEYVEKHEFADAIDAFEAGAEWMQNTMIDKACEWLMEVACQFATKEVMVKEFRKAMEE